jgi:predicted permease
MAGLFLFFQEMFVLYGIAVIGYVVKKKNILSKESDQVFTQLILYITLPSLILFAMDFPFSFSLLKNFAWLVLFSAYALGAACLLAFFMVKKSNLPSSRRGVYQGLIIFGNQGFLGYAICYILFAQQGVVYAAVFNLLYLILIWTYGIYIIAKGQKSLTWTMIFLNPGVLATLCGIIVFLPPFGWPVLVSKLFESVGTTTIPLSMLLIGSLIGNLSFNEIWRLCGNIHLWLAAMAKLLWIPLLLFPLAFFDLPPILIFVAVLITGMPSAPTNSLYAQKYGGDACFASMGVCLTTLFSILSLPVLYGLLQLLLAK